MCLFLCKCHTVLTPVALYYSLKPGPVTPPALFLLKIVFAIQGLLYFLVNFKIICSSSLKNAIGNLLEIAINL